jgi:hypothetical protein
MLIQIQVSAPIDKEITKKIRQGKQFIKRSFNFSIRSNSKFSQCLVEEMWQPEMKQKFKKSIF